MTTVKIKRLAEGAVIPAKGTEGAAAYDLYVPENTLVKTGRNVIKMGFAMELPAKHRSKIIPRSGFAAKGVVGYEFMHEIGDESKQKRYDADVIEGLIDEDYRGEVGVLFKNNSGVAFYLEKGCRIAQMTIEEVIPSEMVEVAELGDTERGEGGFGSTGTK